MEIKTSDVYKGTRILFKDSALKKRTLINNISNILLDFGYEEIMLPIIQHQATFAAKVGPENNNMMFNFKDRGDIDLCLAPEYTAVIQQLSKNIFILLNIKIFQD